MSNAVHLSEKVKKKRRCLSINEKVDVISELLRGEKNKSVCLKYNLKSSTVSTLWKNRNNILAAFSETQTCTKKLRKCDLVDVDSALYTWCMAQSNASLMKIHTEEMACDSGWLERFKSRHNIWEIKDKCEHSEKGGTETTEEKVDEWLPLDLSPTGRQR